jgi:hypothetical protein
VAALARGTAHARGRSDLPYEHIGVVLDLDGSVAGMGTEERIKRLHQPGVLRASGPRAGSYPEIF